MRAGKQKQLNVRSDEAVLIAGRLAKRLGRTTTEIVVQALSDYERAVEPRDADGLTDAQRRRLLAVQKLAQASAAHRVPDPPSSHDWLYDEHGLPK